MRRMAGFATRAPIDSFVASEVLTWLVFSIAAVTARQVIISLSYSCCDLLR
jgi:hypothetical protein